MFVIAGEPLDSQFALKRPRMGGRPSRRTEEEEQRVEEEGVDLLMHMAAGEVVDVDPEPAEPTRMRVSNC